MALTALLLGGLPGGVAAQASDQLGPASADVNCTNFLAENAGGRDHAQAVFDAAGGLDGNDPYLLDADGNQLACDGAEFGSETPATCLNFQAASHAQALLNATAPDDPYNLDPDGNDVACDGGGGGVEEEPLDGPPPAPDPEPPDTTELAAPPLDSGDAGRPDSPGTLDTLEARLDAQFAALEARFAAFELRAEDGFGKFPDTEDESTPGGAPAIVVSSISAQLATAQLGDEGNRPNHVSRAQRGVAAADDGGGSASNASRQRSKDGKNDRAKERQGTKKKARDQHENRDRPSRNNDNGK
jgi:hypothetical protein